MSSSESLSFSGIEFDIKRMNDFKKFGLQPYSVEAKKSQVPVLYGKNSVCDLTSSNDAATNGMDGSIDNKTWSK